MPAERVDYYSEEEYESARDNEQQPEQYPDIVPCCKCGCQMYQECSEPEGNLCPDCKPLTMKRDVI